MVNTRWRLAAYALAAAVTLSGCSSAPSVMNEASSLASLAGANPNLSTFMGLAQSAGLGEMLGGESPLTLLAPSNDAFKALSPDMLTSLAKPENKDQLLGVLKNHIIAGGSSLDEMSRMTGTLAPKSLTGSTLNVESAVDGSLVVGGAKVTETLRAGNGFVHVVDRVILPQ